MPQPLRYNISDWHQLKDVLSNNSRNLHIEVTDLLENDKGSAPVTGTQISVKYDGYRNALFSYLIAPSGTAVTPNLGVYLTKDQILAELSKFGFIVTYDVMRHLPSSMITYLETLNNLHFDKIRRLAVNYSSWGKDHTDVYIVAFMVEGCPKWIDNTYQATMTEFKDALYNGYAMNLSAVTETQQWDWSWLDFVASIDDLLEEYAHESGG